MILKMYSQILHKTNFPQISKSVRKEENYRTTKKKRSCELSHHLKKNFTPISKNFSLLLKKFYTSSKNFTPSRMVRMAAFSNSGQRYSRDCLHSQSVININTVLGFNFGRANLLSKRSQLTWPTSTFCYQHLLILKLNMFLSKLSNYELYSLDCIIH